MNLLFTLLSAGKAEVPEYSPEANDLGNAEALGLGALGYAVVFLGLIALMVVVILVGKVFTAKKAAKADAPVEAVAAEEPAAEPELAPGTAGELKLHDVSPKTAAMIMAIVADQMGKPLNELRFISIKEVK